MSRFARYLLAAVATLTLAACASGPKRPDPTPLSPVASILQAKTAWVVHIGPVPSTFATAVVQGGVVVASSDGTVARIDAQSGHEAWRVRIKGGISAATGSDGTFTAVVNRHNQLVSLGPQGQLLWLYQLPTSVITAPLVTGGTVVVQGADQHLWAFNAANGQKLWSTESRAPALLLHQASGLAVQGDSLLVGTAQGRIESVAIATGAQRWAVTLARPRGITEVERVVSITGAPAIGGSMACARAYQSAIGCADLDTGRLLWVDKADGDTGVSQNGSLLVATQGDGVVQAYVAADGGQRWSNSQLKYRDLSAPLLLGMTVAVGDYQGYITFLSAKDGSIIGRVSTDGSAIESPMVAAGKTLVAVTRSGGVYGFVPE
ncbi:MULTISPECIES: outer membrane protein assembly factor BamB [Thiomonas]|uniref:Outer membrane protein assembly factor BamB n=1 Tax=Thiomonas delicata TaxID=364030 RepID=A0A238D9L4_THIDL|nr:MULTISPECIES: outer membrane protein assembly factor BamB [Thiomonas]SBP89814.1 putative Quinonprotein alcohol dehydrogenase [Thiomonas delicata]